MQIILQKVLTEIVQKVDFFCKEATQARQWPIFLPVGRWRSIRATFGRFFSRDARMRVPVYAYPRTCAGRVIRAGAGIRRCAGDATKM